MSSATEVHGLNGASSTNGTNGAHDGLPPKGKRVVVVGLGMVGIAFM